MSSQTPNIGLTLPTGSENVSRQIINDNNTKIDTAIGGTAGRELLGYKENGDTASQAIADGSFVVWKGDLYKANGAISQGTAFSSSNLTAVPSGGFNDLQGQVSTLSDSLKAYGAIGATAGSKFTVTSRTQIFGMFAYTVVKAHANQVYGSSDVIATVPVDYRPNRAIPSAFTLLMRSGQSTITFVATETIDTNGNVTEGFTASSGQSGDDLLIVFIYNI